MKNLPSIKMKIFFLYLILFSTVLISGAYIYKEAIKFTIPEERMARENNKVFLVSSAINLLYSTESLSRNALLTTSNKDVAQYHSELENFEHKLAEIETLTHDRLILEKITTIKSLLDKKKNSFAELLNTRRKILSQTNYSDAFSEIHHIKSEIEKSVEPVVTQSGEVSKRTAWQRLFKGDRIDTITTTVNYANISDSLINAMQRIIDSTQNKINEQQQQLFQQELKLLQDNKTLTTQLNGILQNIEQNILTLSYQQINESKSHISSASTNIAYIGGSALLVIIILGFIIIKDINQNNTYRLALEQLSQERSDLLRSKTMLLATVTHDLQTPLGSLIGFTDLLNQTPLSEKQARYANNIKTSSQYIANLVSDLTDFSRLENNKLSIQMQDVNISTLIENTCHVLQENATNKKIELKWNIDPSLNNLYQTDPYRVNQILTNLISNAIKFTQKGYVEVQAKLVDFSLILQVNDTGIGIKQDELDNIFKEFQQANQGIEKKFGGTGLGLNISRRLASLLQGELHVESKLNEGSSFTLTLPLQEHKGEQTNAEAQTKLFIDQFKDNTIMVVDDDQVQLSLMREILQNTFKKVVLIDDATEVVDYLLQHQVDIILTDMQMPKLDGFELLQSIKAVPQLSKIPLVALSGKRDLTTEDFTELGFTTFHYKPLNLEQLIIQIGEILYPDTKGVNYQAMKIKMVENKKLPEKTKNTTDELYQLDSLKQFIGEDKDALSKILVVFIESTKENLLDLTFAYEDKDIEQLGNVAHKMLPMFKQIKVVSVIDDLEKIERQHFAINDQDLANALMSITNQTNKLLRVLAEEHL